MIWAYMWILLKLWLLITFHFSGYLIMNIAGLILVYLFTDLASSCYHFYWFLYFWFAALSGMNLPFVALHFLDWSCWYCLELAIPSSKYMFNKDKVMKNKSQAKMYCDLWSVILIIRKINSKWIILKNLATFYLILQERSGKMLTRWVWEWQVSRIENLKFSTIFLPE